jgi:dTDP-L-rhamnose 4-epimerase
MTQILLTGGAGFIGTHVARLAIESGHSVRILDNLSSQVHGADAAFEPPPGVDFLLGDVAVRSDWEAALRGIDTIVHLAAETGTGQSMYEIDRYYMVNVQGTALLFDILANSAHSISNVILASSRSVYGEGAYLCRECAPEGRRCFPRPRSPEQRASHDWDVRCPECGSVPELVATAEDDQLSPASIYAASKLAQEQLVRVACSAMGIAHSILRFQNVFGEGQSLKNPYTGILSIFSTRIRLGLPLPIFEDGKESRDFVHVQDAAEAVLACVEKRAADGATINVGSGKAASIMEVAQLLCRTFGSDIVPHITREYRVGDIRHNLADLTRLEQQLDFRPRIALEDGLKRFSDWVRGEAIPPDMLDKANDELKTRKMMG